MLWHVVLISFRLDASELLKHEVFYRYQTLDKDCGGEEAGILLWLVRENLDQRIKAVGRLEGSKVDLVEISIFRDNDALQAFRNHPKHKELTNITREIADWMVGDVELTSEDTHSFDGIDSPDMNL